MFTGTENRRCTVLDHYLSGISTRLNFHLFLTDDSCVCVCVFSIHTTTIMRTSGWGFINNVVRDGNIHPSWTYWMTIVSGIGV